MSILSAALPKAPARDSLLRRTLAARPAFTLSLPADAARPAMETFVADRFAEAWGARVTQFLPLLLGMQCLGHYTAVAGIRPAAQGPLFLERYLDTSVEAILSAAVQEDVPRRAIAEIGNLVAGQRGASHLLFLVLTAALHRAGYRWIVFTATHPLRNNLTRLGYPVLKLATAARDRLEPAALAEWGSYYDSEPWVMAGTLDDAMRLAEQRPLLRRVLRLYRGTIAELASGVQP